MNDVNYSLIIPFYNSYNTIRRLINSIPKREDLEVIIVDDCSTLNHKDLALLKKQYNNFLWVQTDENKGAGAARNLGLKFAKGKWIFFADSDDCFNSDVSKIFDEYVNLEYDIVYFNANIIYKNGPTNSSRYTKFFQQIENIRIKGHENIRFVFTQVWAKLFKREFIEKYHIKFDEVIISNDVMFSTLCDYFAKNIKIDKRYFYIQYKHSGSVSRLITVERMLVKLNIHCRRYIFLKDNNCHFKDIYNYIGNPIVSIIRNKMWNKEVNESVKSILKKWHIPRNLIYKIIIQYYMINFSNKVKKIL